MNRNHSHYVTWTWVIALLLALFLLWTLMTGKATSNSCCHPASQITAVTGESDKAPETIETPPAVVEAFSFSASEGSFDSSGDQSNVQWIDDVDALGTLLGSNLEASGDDHMIVLTGTVDSDSEKQQKGLDAQAFFGENTSIDNQIIVALDAADHVPSVVKIYFDSGYHRLPPGERENLQPIIAFLQNNPDAKAILSGFHDPTGVLASNQALAKKRAQSIYEVLVTSISSDRIEMRKPVSTDGGGDLNEARRVEISIE